MAEQLKSVVQSYESIAGYAFRILIIIFGSRLISAHANTNEKTASIGGSIVGAGKKRLSHILLARNFTT